MVTHNEQTPTPLTQTIVAGAKAAVAEALERHRRLGQSIVVMRDGEIVTLQAEEIPSRENSQVGENS